MVCLIQKYLTFAAFAIYAVAQNGSSIGYGNVTSSISPSNTSLSFGQRYAVLNLDMISALVAPLNGTTAGQQWINATSTWIGAIHSLNPQPLTIFSRIYFAAPFQPELGVGVPFSNVAGGLVNVTEASAQGKVYSAFAPSGEDVQLAKTRYYAGE